MRPQLNLRAAGAVSALGALSMTYAAVGWPATARSDTQGAPIATRIADRHLHFGQRLVVTGIDPGAPAGRPIALEYQRGGGAWTVVAQGATAAGGRFRLTAKLLAGGAVRVTRGGSPTARAATADAGGADAGAPQTVTVSAALTTTGRRLDVLAGHAIRVSGTLRPARVGGVVRLQRRAHGRWRTIARDRTGAAGRYTLRYRPRTNGSAVLRVRYAGDPSLAAATRIVGRMDVYRRAFASWYGPGLYGNRLGCGGTLTPGTLGVANKSLPCGTKVTLRYHGHTVRVAVVDRGPYVAGREFDLTAATKRKLHFGSTGTVWTTR